MSKKQLWLLFLAYSLVVVLLKLHLHLETGITKPYTHHPPPGIIKPCTILHPAPSTSTQLISTSTQLHPPPPSSFQPPPSSLQHPQQYLNQNIARNWAISPNLGQKIKSFPFWLKIDSESRLRFLKFRPQNPFLGKFGPKNSKLFVLSENWCT